ncbi:MAG TPA: hypothetical protein VH796_08085 [Nitrososphaeraceae archaeon]
MSEEIRFRAATVYARRIIKSPKLHTYGTHRWSMAKLDEGLLIIDQRWFSLSAKK